MLNKKQLFDMPIIDTENFIMRPVELNDAKDMFEYGSDIEVVATLPWGPYSNLEEVRSSIENLFLNRPDKGIPVAYAIIWKENNKMIGTCDFHTFSNFNKSGEIGYVLNKKYWGRGIITKAVMSLIEVGFEYLDLIRIQIKHSTVNDGSRRVIEKCGFIKEGLLRKDGIIKGEAQDNVVYSLIKSDYKK